MATGSMDCAGEFEEMMGSSRTWWLTVVIGLAMAVSARAQFGPPSRGLARRSGRSPVVIMHLAPPAGPMGGVFSFVGPLSDVRSAVVKGHPFSAEVVRDTVEDLADGNRIERTSTGMIARDSAGRTRRVMTLQNIGPWASAGRAPQLVIIDDPVTGKVYTLDRGKNLAIEMRPPPRLNWVRGSGQGPRVLNGSKVEIRTESLGDRKMDGVLVEGTKTIRTIPAGMIGNEKPIVITIERWYSPELQTTVSLKRTDPRFGTTRYELENVRLGEPPESLFEVPSGYTIQPGSGLGAYRRGGDPGSKPDYP